MRLKYWMVVYPYHMSGDGMINKPFISNQPLAVTADAKLLTFYVDVPDDLFGAVAVEATPAQPDSPGGDK